MAKNKKGSSHRGTYRTRLTPSMLAYHESLRELSRTTPITEELLEQLLVQNASGFNYFHNKKISAAEVIDYLYWFIVVSLAHHILLSRPPEWLLTQLISNGNDHTYKGAQGNNGLSKLSSFTQIGSRNATLASITGHLLRRYVDPSIVEMLMRAWNSYCTEQPLSENEFIKTLDSIAHAELSRRKGI